MLGRQIDITEEIKTLREFAQNISPTENNTDIVRNVIADIGYKIYHTYEPLLETNLPEIKKMLDEWAVEYMAIVEDILSTAIANLKQKDSNFSLVLATWAGPQGTGKGTNIEAIAKACEVLEQAYTSRGMQMPESVAPLVRMNTGKSSAVIVGTGGIANQPQGEYKDLFNQAYQITGAMSRKGELVSDYYIGLFVELMILLRVAEGSQKIQLDLWPRTENQFVQYQSLLDICKQKGVTILTDVVNLKLLTPEEMSHMVKDLEGYAAKSRQIGQLKKQKMKESWFTEPAEKVKNMNFASQYPQMYEIMEVAVARVIAEVKQEMKVQTDVVAANIMAENDRALERMAYRFKKSVEAGEMPRTDELPHTQLNRLASYEMETSPAFLEAAKNIDVDFVSSFQSPALVVHDILNAAIEEIEDGRFAKENSKVWGVFVATAGEMAEKIVKKEKDITEGMVERIVAVL
jgi:hypothetical protein